MQDHTFRTRLNYVSFKRLIIVMEALILVMVLGVIIHYRVPPPWFELIIAVQVSRICAEIINHLRLQETFNVRDNWLFFPFL